jgi:hypothetical protein
MANPSDYHAGIKDKFNEDKFDEDKISTINNDFLELMKITGYDVY